MDGTLVGEGNHEGEQGAEITERAGDFGEGGAAEGDIVVAVEVAEL